MTRWIRQILLVSLAAVVGCAAKSPQPPAAPLTKPSSAQAEQANDDKTYFSLDQITPVPHLASPATQPATRPALDSLIDFAKARDAMLQGERYTAITQLEKAIALDPDSYLLHYELGKAYLAVAGMEDRAITAFERAAQLEPNHLDLQEQLGRQYLASGDIPHSLEHLRLALQTTDYAEDDGQAAVADFFLARALQQAGYDRAALDSYNSLVQRLKTPTLQIRQDQELAYLIDRPELLYVEIGELYEKHGQFAAALSAYQPAAEDEPDNFELQSRVARMLASLGRRDEALAKTANLIIAQHASAPSLLLLTDVCQRLNLPGGPVAALTKLHADHPDDLPVLFALTDALIAQNRQPDAEQMLTAALDKSPGDTQIVRRLFAIYVRSADSVPAAQLLTVSLARNPDSLQNLAPLWSQLLRPQRYNRLKLQTVQLMSLPPNAEAAREFWISRLADLTLRDALARSAMQRATRFVPPFAPAFRAALEQTWAQGTLSVPQKIEASKQLSDLAQAGGNPSLAAELNGLSLLNQNQPAAAADQLSKAIALAAPAKPSPDLLLTHALALHKPGKDEQFENLLWKLIRENSLYEESYATLFRYYAAPDIGEFSEAMKVLSTWLVADPQSISARLLDADLNTQVGSYPQAQAKLQRLFEEDPDNPQVLEAMQTCYVQSNHLVDFVQLLETYHAQHPKDTEIAARLVGVYVGQKEMDKAQRVLDQTRTADSGDADLLYSIAQLYEQIDRKPIAEQILQQVIQLDPSHAGASNDLGYEWADEGKNLPQAETLIRTAVAAEPDNQSFLDSLGWVMYKQGKFDEARKYLEQAVGPADFPDPVVLNHLGDALYRLSRSADAAKTWQRSLKGIGDGQVERDDLTQLRPQLQQKIKAVQSNQPADVAPVTN